MCGLFGIINVKKSKFDRTLFNVLGVHNDTRGGDSCGIFIDGQVEYGTKETKLYSNFLKTSKLLKETNECSIALGHCRKASVGLINESTAQPVVITDSEGKVEFVVMHNGTIYNYKALAAKYIPHVNISGMTDSQVMARIFYHCGYDCLSEYYGGAVFVIVDYRPETPRIFLWKGASKNNTYSPTLTEERPFYFIQTNDTLVFSSLYSYIEAAYMDNALTLVPNELVEVKGDDIYFVADYPRDKVAQTLPSNYSTTYYEEVYGYYENDYQSWDNHNCFNTTSFQDEKKKKQKKEKKVIRVTKEGIYHIDNHPVHGKRHVDSLGNVYDEASDNTIECWFWDGILLYGNVEFIFLVNACKYYQLNPEDVKWCSPEILNYLSPYPVKDPDYISKNEDIWFKCTDMETLVPYTGPLHLFTESKQAFCLDGIDSHTVYNNKDITFESLKRFIKEKKVDITKLYNLLYQNGYNQ